MSKEEKPLILPMPHPLVKKGKKHTNGVIYIPGAIHPAPVPEPERPLAQASDTTPADKGSPIYFDTQGGYGNVE